ncbi:hypothetical protein NC99_00230 [Sunxiuqinia dokdonensis]|uniref:Uncharacterized protein n=1 Tax=Sunxiuqinia dokdonensis TaxID=1409788 RepID=A0A0L8VFE0_9BACT|nr:hypothetical protein NC99_00230 [Sunxiuqinia dokdonensis]
MYQFLQQLNVFLHLQVVFGRMNSASKIRFFYQEHQLITN